MGEMGINLTLPDYRLIFDKIDFKTSTNLQVRVELVFHYIVAITCNL